MANNTKAQAALKRLMRNQESMLLPKMTWAKQAAFLSGFKSGWNAAMSKRTSFNDGRK